MAPRVLHLVDSLGVSGLSITLLDYLTNADTSSFESHVCYLRANPQRYEAFSRVSASLHDLGSGPGGAVGVIARLVRLLRKFDISLLHVHGFLSLKYALVAALVTRTPVVYEIASEKRMRELRRDAELGPWSSVSGLRRHLGPSGLRRRFNRFVEERTVRHYIAVSRHLAEALERFVSAPISVIPPGIDHRPFSEQHLSNKERKQLRTSLGVDPDAPLLLTVARMAPGKGHIDLVRAMRHLVAEHPTATLACVGEGRLRSAVQAEIDACGVGGNVKLLGNRSDVPALLAISDLFVFASASEGFGRVVVEAMMAGKPCVCYSLLSLAHMLEDGVTGMLVPQGDVEFLARRAGELLSSPRTAAEIGRAARAQAIQHPDSPAVARAIETVYSQMLVPASQGKRPRHTPKATGRMRSIARGPLKNGAL